MSKIFFIPSQRDSLGFINLTVAILKLIAKINIIHYRPNTHRKCCCHLIIKCAYD